MRDDIPLIVLGGYLLFLLVLGVVGYLRSKAGAEDYYLAGRRQGWIVSTLTIMATFFSSWALLGASGKVYTEGLVFFLFALNVPLSGACIYLFGRGIRRLGRQNGYVTPGDMIADYYGGEAVRILVSLTCILYVVPYVVMQIQAGGLLFQVLVEEPLLERWDNFQVGCVVLALITTVYVMVGGMRSVAWTDVFQGLLLVTGMLLGGYVVLQVLGGPAEFMEKVAALPEAWLTAPGASRGWPPLFLFSVCLLGSSGTMVSPAQWMRYYAADSSRTLRRAALIFSLVLTACFLFGVMLVGIGGQVLYPSPTDAIGNPLFTETGALQVHEAVRKPDDILIRVLHDQLPAVWPVAGIWIVSIITVAIAAGSMSTADSNLHALSAVLTRDIYDRYLRSARREKGSMWVGRLVILVAAVASLVLVLGAHRAQVADEPNVLARSLRMIVDVGILAISFSAQLLPATVDMLWIRRGSRLGVTLGLLAGLGATACFHTYPPFSGSSVGELEIRMMPGAWGLIVNCLVLAVVSSLGRPPGKATEYAEALKR